MVHVGEQEGEDTLWAINPPEPLPQVENNYDVLIGYKTASAQMAAVRKLLHGTIAAARTEYRRAVQEEIVIWGPRGPDKRALL
jgi:hypothetical protein